MKDTWESYKKHDLFLLTLAIGLGGVVALVDDEVFGPVVFSAGEVRVEDGLGALGVSLFLFCEQLHDQGGD